MQRYILPIQDQAVESQEALQRRHCAASRIAAAWHGHQSRLQMRQLLRVREQAEKDCAASAVQVMRTDILVIITPRAHYCVCMIGSVLFPGQGCISSDCLTCLNTVQPRLQCYVGLALMHGL